MQSMAEPDASHGVNGSNGTPTPFSSRRVDGLSGSPTDAVDTPQTPMSGDASSATWPPPAGADERNWWAQHSAPRAGTVPAATPGGDLGSGHGGVSANSDWWSVDVRVNLVDVSAAAAAPEQTHPDSDDAHSVLTPKSDADAWWSEGPESDLAGDQWWADSSTVLQDGAEPEANATTSLHTASSPHFVVTAEAVSPARSTESHGRPPLSALPRIGDTHDGHLVVGHFSVAGTATRADDGVMTRVSFDSPLTGPLLGWCLEGNEQEGPYVLEISIEAALNCGGRDIDIYLEDEHPQTPSGFTLTLRARSGGPYALSGIYRVRTS